MIGTLIERQTRLIRLLHLPSRDADALRRAMSDRIADLPRSLLRSIAWDQGIEMPAMSPSLRNRQETDASVPCSRPSAP